MLLMFSQSVVASAIFFAVVCWGTSMKAKDTNRLNKLIRKADSIGGSRLATLEEVVEQMMMTKLLDIMNNTSHFLTETVNILRSSFSNGMIQPHCY